MTQSTTDSVAMDLRGVETKDSPYWTFHFQSDNAHAEVCVHYNSEFARKFMKGPSEIQFFKRVRLVVEE